MEFNKYSFFIDDVMIKAQLAACLEVSGYPKPGNVHRLRDYPDTRYEHFIAGSIAIGPAIRMAVINGIKAGLNNIKLDEINIGLLIKNAILNIKNIHYGGNTHFGIITLFIPLASSTGFCIANNDKLTLRDLRNYFDLIVKSTSINDAIYFYEAARMINVGNLGKVKLKGIPDITSNNYREEIIRSNLTLYRLMEISSKWDSIAWEFTNKLKTICEIGYPSLIKFYNETKDINMAIVHTFLKLLSIKPDTLIARKIGLEETDNIIDAVKIGMNIAKEISEKAREILDSGGLRLVTGTELLLRLDEELAIRKLNPGSTADMLATAIFIALLLGFKF